MHESDSCINLKTCGVVAWFCTRYKLCHDEIFDKILIVGQVVLVQKISGFTASFPKNEVHNENENPKSEQSSVWNIQS